MLSNNKIKILIITIVLINLACGLNIPFLNDGDVPPTPAPSGGSASEQGDTSKIIVEPTEKPESTQIDDETIPATELDEPDETSSTENDAVSPEKLADDQIFITLGGEPPTLDPHLSGDATSAEYVVEIFSGLMAYNQELNIVPDVAESYEVSDDGLVYTFKLRPNATFEDGKPIRAEDFKWSFERACDPATRSHTADAYMGDIVGCREKLQGQVAEVAGVTVIDEQTLQLIIDEPKGFFLAKMTYPTAYVLDQVAVERGGATWYTNPNGSGPFKLDEYSPDEGMIVLEKNENFYRQPHPILERVIYLVNAPINGMTGYEQGLEPIAPGVTFDAIQIGSANLSRATDPNNPLSQEFSTINEFSIFYIGFNINKPPFDDTKIRQAFNLALDKKRIVKLAFQGTVPVANGIVPPNMPGYENPDLSDYEFDSERALELIADSSYGDVSELPEITLHVSGIGGAVGPVLESIAESYKVNLGVEITIEQSPWAEFLQDLNGPEPSYQLYQLGWVADYPDPQNFLEILFHSKSSQNHGGYSNPEVDNLLDEAKAARDPQVRLSLYQQAEQKILDDAAWVPIYFSVENWLVKPYVRNFQPPPMKIPKWQYVSIVEH
ncbi:peptide ABC transporter substrate-binding protein [Anaerolineales bacterium HSG24]|nr:peptide ABC transporter substrate-binding protein [Anaerolineales bacterium HSG24]